MTDFEERVRRELHIAAAQFEPTGTLGDIQRKIGRHERARQRRGLRWLLAGLGRHRRPRRAVA